MTRKEAIAKLKSINHHECNHTLDALEALGLIKFDEEKKVPPPASVIALECGNYPTPHLKADKIIDALAKYGYIIARKDD